MQSFCLYWEVRSEFPSSFFGCFRCLNTVDSDMVSAGWAYSVAISCSTVESQLLLADVKHVHQCTDVSTDTGFKALECCEVRIEWDGIKRLYQQCGNLLGKCPYMYRKYIYCIVPPFIMHYKLNLVFQFLWDSLNANLYSFTDYQPTVGSTQAGFLKICVHVAIFVLNICKCKVVPALVWTI